MRHIPYSRQSIDDEDIKVVVDVLKSDFITQGPKVQEFESALAEYCGSKYAVVFSSGTAALHASCFSSGICSGDEIITSPVTFAATANAVLYLGARPVFVDIEHDTANINPEFIQKAITKKTKAIIPVDYAGHPADLTPIHEIADSNGLIIIEDACHALGASYKNKKIGSISDMTVFSFHPVKSITTGEGGAVLTDNSAYYEKLVMFRSHGITKDVTRFKNKSHGEWYYEMQFLGFNLRLTDIHSALGLSQLRKLDSFIKSRKETAYRYNKAFSDNKWFDTPVLKEYAESAWHLYPIRLKSGFIDRKPEIFKKLREKSLGVQVHYIPVYLQPYYKGLGYSEGTCPEAETFYKKEISLPIYNGITEDDIKYVVDAVSDIFKEL